MSVLSTTINITRKLSLNSENTYNYNLLRVAIREALEDNFYAILNRLGIDTISVLSDTNSPNITLIVSEDENVIIVNELINNVSTEIARINYTPYITYVKYTQYVTVNEQGFASTENRYYPVATVLLSIIIDKNFCGFSILSPADIQLVDSENNIYKVNNAISVNSNQSSIQSEDELSVIDLPDIIKLQSSLLYDESSYYEIKYNDINEPYNTITVPCINGNVYYNTNIYSFKSLFGDLFMNFNVEDDESVIGNIVMNPKLLCLSNDAEGNIITTNQVQAFSSNIFDCPALNVPEYWTQDSPFNIGECVPIGDSQYIISDKNTLIQLDNTEIYGINTSVTYDGKPHMFGLVYPLGSTAYYKFSDDTDSEPEWKELPKDLSEIKDYKDAQQYLFDYKVVIPSGNNTDDKVYYGNVELNINKAEQTDYLVQTYNGTYDGLPHTIYVFTDAIVEYSLDGTNWSVTPPTFIEPGTYTVYYKLQKENYITVIDNVDVVIYVNTDTESLEFGINTKQNVIVMRQQLYSKVSTNLFLLPTDNKIYLSTNNPTPIPVDEFTGKFPNPTSEIPIQSVLGTFTVSPADYYMLLECYLPWYYHGKEPSENYRNNLDDMMGDTVTFTVEYTNVANPTEDDWIVLETDIKPDNAFYQYRITNISKPFTNSSGIPVGSLWGDSSKNQYAVKRAVAKLSLNSLAAGINNKLIRIKCTHTGIVTQSNNPAYPYYKYGNKISSQFLGISLVTLSEYSTPSMIQYASESIEGDSYNQISLKFKSALTSNAFFSYNTGNNLQYSGCGELNYETFTINNHTYPGIDNVTGLYDKQAYVMWRNGDSNSAPGTMAQNWHSDSYFIILKDQLCRIQFNSDKLIETDSSIVTLTNTDKIYAYIPCKTGNGGGPT